MLHDFVNPDARDEGIVRRDLFGFFEAFGVDDQVARDGVRPQGAGPWNRSLRFPAS